MPINAAEFAAYFGKNRNSGPPRHLGTRYDLEGRFQREPGNTVVCHLVDGSQTQLALADAQSRYRAMPEARQLAFTPLESYHMTLFQGIIEGRRRHPFWPSDVAEDTPIDEMTALFERRLELFSSGPIFQVEVITALPTGLVVDGITAADRHAMADWRNRFAEVFGYRHPDHDSYQFHITMAYMIGWIADERLPQWQAMLAGVEAEIKQRTPVLELRAPAFCSFEDMNWFEELVPFNAQ